MDRETEAILKISKDTIKNKVKWSIVYKDRIVLGEEAEIIDNAYVAEYYGKNIRVFHYRYKAYHDYIEYNWIDGYKLEIVDDDNNSLWEFSQNEAIVGLYDTIRKKTSEVSSFIDDILKDV